MVDRIKLILLHEAQKMRKFHCDDTVLGEQKLEALNEVVQSWNVSKYVVANNEIGAAFLCCQLASGIRRKKFDPGFDPLLLCRACDITRGLNTKYGNAKFREIL